MTLRTECATVVCCYEIMTQVLFLTHVYFDASSHLFYWPSIVTGPLLITLGLLYPVAVMIAAITREKELRQKELMKMMSVTESDIGWAWFANFFLLSVVTAICTAAVSSVLYEKSAGVLLWIFWQFTFLAIVVFCMLIASLTSKATRGVLIGLLVFFLGSFLTLATDFKTGSSGVIALMSLHPVAAFSYGLQLIGSLEEEGVGLQWSTASATDNPSGYTFVMCVRFLLLDSFLWGLVTWYLNRVIRPDYGQAWPWYFPFLSRYWVPGRVQRLRDDDNEDASKHDESIPTEPVGDALLRQNDEGTNIRIHDLQKDFGNDKKAVDGLNLDMYNGQITALLGHNGAGKTTTIGMLTGALKPTGGHAIVAGKDIRTQMGQIRQDIGICLQHDCLFPILTVREHIAFFSRLKGLYAKMTNEEAEEQIDRVLRDVALFEKRNTLSKNLSGGMKRKLSVAIAFCGGSQVVLLDEPTSGMVRVHKRDKPNSLYILTQPYSCRLHTGPIL